MDVGGRTVVTYKSLCRMVGLLRMRLGLVPLLSHADGTDILMDKDDLSSRESLPMVSAIVSVYKAERFLLGCLDDLIGQTLWKQGKLEIVVVDTGSPEGESAMVRKYQEQYGEDRIRLVRTEDRRSLYAAWNLGILASKGRYLTNANADDRHRPDALQILANRLEQDSSTDLIYSDCAVSTIANGTWEAVAKKCIYRYPKYRPSDALLHFQFGIHPMWRRSLHDEIGFFDEDYRAAGDWDFNIRFALAGKKARKIGQVLGLYYMAESTISFSGNVMADENERIHLKYRTPANIFRLLDEDEGKILRGQKIRLALNAYARRALSFRPGWMSSNMADRDFSESLTRLAQEQMTCDQTLRSLRIVYHLQFGAIVRKGGMPGVETASIALCRELASRGHEVHLVAQSPTVAWKEIGLTVELDVPANRKRIQALIDRANIFIAASHARSFFRFKIPHGTKKIVHFHHADLEYTLGTDIEKRQVLSGDGGCDAILCVSDYSKQKLEKCGARKNLVETVPNGFDANVFYLDASMVREPLRILFVGVFREHKGPDIAIKVVAELRARGIDCCLRMAGSNDLYGEAVSWFDVEMIRQNNPWVEFLGVLTKDELREEYNRAGFILCPSRIESFGMVSVEAQACGCIPVVSAIGGLPETLLDQITGIVVPEYDSYAFANAVASLLSDSARMAQMSQNASTSVRKRFSWKTVADRIESIGCQKPELQ